MYARTDLDELGVVLEAASTTGVLLDLELYCRSVARGAKTAFEARFAIRIFVPSQDIRYAKQRREVVRKPSSARRSFVFLGCSSCTGHGATSLHSITSLLLLARDSGTLGDVALGAKVRIAIVPYSRRPHLTAVMLQCQKA